jgi:hypothetical protein
LWQPSNERQKLINAIEKHKVLRFIGGYPLPPDLDSEDSVNSEDSVKNAILKLGPNVALASFKIDSFRANFKSASEAEYVLAPLEDALEQKRKGT